MKYKMIPHERYKAVSYLITRDELILWATPGMTVWIGKPISKFLDWVDRKAVGHWRLVDASCAVPDINEPFEGYEGTILLSVEAADRMIERMDNQGAA